MYQLPPLSNEYHFEDLLVDLFNAIENTSSFQTFGVKGQKQKGIDVFSGSLDNRTVIQCKKKDISKNDKKIREKLIEEFEESLCLAEELTFSYDRFIFASTYKDDRILQEYALSKADEKKIQIEYWGWDTISKKIVDYKSLIDKYYPEFTISPSVPTNSLLPFKREDSFKILILPFNNYGTSQSGEFEKALYNYFDSLSGSNLEIRIKRISGRSFSDIEARKIRIEEGVNIVIYGSYESDVNEKEVWLKYEADIDSEEICNSSRYGFRKLLDIECGYLPGDLHHIIHYTLGLKAYINEDFQGAISEFYKLVVEIKLWDARTIIFIADSFLRLEDYQSAKIFFEFALDHAPDLDFVYYQLGTVNYFLEDYHSALKNYTKAIELNGQQPDLLHFYGETLRELGDLKSSKDYFIRSITQNPENLDSYYSLSKLFYDEGNYEEAERYSKIILKKNENHFDSNTLIGNIYREVGNYELAIFYLEKAVKVNPKSSIAHNNLGLIYNETNKKDVEKHYLKAIEIDPSFSVAYCNYGHFLYDSERYNEAKSILNKAIGLNKKYYRAYNILGVIYAKEDNITEAITSYLFAYISGSDLAMSNIDGLFASLNIPNFLKNSIDLIPKLNGEHLDLFLRTYTDTLNKVIVNNNNDSFKKDIIGLIERM